VTPASATRLPELLTKHEGPILERWVEEQLATIGHRRGLMSDVEMREQSREFLALVRQAAKNGGADVEAGPWTGVREFLGRISASRAVQGFSPSETATFVFSL
jgi:rsbT co-antagonist protein RsbR